MLPPPPTPTLFPYTTLFRSRRARPRPRRPRRLPGGTPPRDARAAPSPAATVVVPSAPSRVARVGRSEEHTSELQSLAYLVCRLLLEKKKKKQSRTSCFISRS